MGNNIYILMRTFSLALVAGAASAFTAMESKFMVYVMEHNKNYKNIEEFTRRMSLFQGRYNRIQELNEQYSNFTLGVNKMTDWTEAEIKSVMGYKGDTNMSVTTRAKHVESVPDSVNWNDSGCVSAVKDQGQCGSCWTFATMESVESAWCIAHGDLPILATQQLVDCVNASIGYPDDDGCNGG